MDPWGIPEVVKTENIINKSTIFANHLSFQTTLWFDKERQSIDKKGIYDVNNTLLPRSILTVTM